jgi:hypothetical protein
MFLGSKVRPVRRADNLTAICEPIVWTLGSLTSHNPICLHGLLQGLHYRFRPKFRIIFMRISRYCTLLPNMNYTDVFSSFLLCNMSFLESRIYSFPAGRSWDSTLIRQRLLRTYYHSSYHTA